MARESSLESELSLQQLDSEKKGLKGRGALMKPAEAGLKLLSRFLIKQMFEEIILLGSHQ